MDKRHARILVLAAFALVLLIGGMVTVVSATGQRGRAANQPAQPSDPARLRGTPSQPVQAGTPSSPDDNVVVDGGFEAGTPNPHWSEASTNFGTPLCDVQGCGTGAGTGPHSGSFWVWFGGIAAYEQGSVSQMVTIPAEPLP